MNTGNSIIAVHFGQPCLRLAPDSFPPSNWVGALLFHRLLAAALSHAGLLDEGHSGATGELNDCVFMATVSDQDAAVHVIRGELGQAAVLSLCQIAVAEPDGWRCVYPSSEVRMEWLLDTERHELAEHKWHTLVERQIEALQEITRRLLAGGGKNPPGPLRDGKAGL